MQSRLGKQPVLQGMLVAAREDERRRCARELHDETLQALGALRVRLSVARGSDDVRCLQAALDGAVGELEREIANLRALITDLRPPSLDHLGLAAALETLRERALAWGGARVEIDVRLHDAQVERLSSEIETAVYRLVQEGLTNAVRHARADRINVSVHARDDRIDITVADDGCGFDPEARFAGVGITGMRERVGLVGGQLEIRSSTIGTTIIGSVPTGRAQVTRPRKLACL